MLASSYSCSHFTTGKHKSRPGIAAEASLLFLVSQSVNVVPSTQTVLTVDCIAKPQNHQHIPPGIHINRLRLQQIPIIQIKKCYHGVCIMGSGSVIVWHKCCIKIRSYIHNHSRRISKPSLNEHQKHGNLRNFTWNIMTRNGCNLKIKDGADHWKCTISFLLFMAVFQLKEKKKVAGFPDSSGLFWCPVGDTVNHQWRGGSLIKRWF